MSDQEEENGVFHPLSVNLTSTAWIFPRRYGTTYLQATLRRMENNDDNGRCTRQRSLSQRSKSRTKTAQKKSWGRSSEWIRTRHTSHKERPQDNVYVMPKSRSGCSHRVIQQASSEQYKRIPERDKVKYETSKSYLKQSDAHKRTRPEGISGQSRKREQSSSRNHRNGIIRQTARERQYSVCDRCNKTTERNAFSKKGPRENVAHKRKSDYITQCQRSLLQIRQTEDLVPRQTVKETLKPKNECGKSVPRRTGMHWGSLQRRTGMHWETSQRRLRQREKRRKDTKRRYESQKGKPERDESQDIKHINDSDTKSTKRPVSFLVKPAVVTITVVPWSDTDVDLEEEDQEGWSLSSVDEKDTAYDESLESENEEVIHSKPRTRSTKKHVKPRKTKPFRDETESTEAQKVVDKIGKKAMTKKPKIEALHSVSNDDIQKSVTQRKRNKPKFKRHQKPNNNGIIKSTDRLAEENNRARQEEVKAAKPSKKPKGKKMTAGKKKQTGVFDNLTSALNKTLKKKSKTSVEAPSEEYEDLSENSRSFEDAGVTDVEKQKRHKSAKQEPLLTKQVGQDESVTSKPKPVEEYNTLEKYNVAGQKINIAKNGNGTVKKESNVEEKRETYNNAAADEVKRMSLEKKDEEAETLERSAEDDSAILPKKVSNNKVIEETQREKPKETLEESSLVKEEAEVKVKSETVNNVTDDVTPRVPHKSEEEDEETKVKKEESSVKDDSATLQQKGSNVKDAEETPKEKPKEKPKETLEENAFVREGDEVKEESETVNSAPGNATQRVPHESKDEEPKVKKEESSVKDDFATLEQKNTNDKLNEEETVKEKSGDANEESQAESESNEEEVETGRDQLNEEGKNDDETNSLEEE